MPKDRFEDVKRVVFHVIVLLKIVATVQIVPLQHLTHLFQPVNNLVLTSSPLISFVIGPCLGETIEHPY